MCLMLNCYQSKVDYSINHVLYKLHSNHKVKSYSRYTQDKEKETKVYPLQKNINSQRKTEKKKTKELQKIQKTIRQ